MSAGIPALPPPVFLNDADGLDPNLILADLITAYQAATGRTLQPAQVERLFINLLAYREALIRNQMQYTGEQNLLTFATAPMIDYLGELVDVTRLAAQPALTTLQFSLTNPLTVSFDIAAGTQVNSVDGLYSFATSVDLVIPAGSTTGTVAASCTTPGAGGNGYVAGQIATLLNPNSDISSVTNTTTSSGGADQETDDHLRARIQIAPNQFSVAGPGPAYRFFALSVNPSIIDALITTPVPGTVNAYILTGPITVQPALPPNNVGIPGGTLIAAVGALLSSDPVRPLTDTVVVLAATEVDYVVNATLTLYLDADPIATQAAALQSGTELAINNAQRIQRDIVPSEWIAALSVAGVYEVTLSNPPDWEGASTPGVTVGTLIKPTVNNTGGFIYQCTTPGTTGASEPNPWNQTVGGSQVNGGVIWMNIGISAAALTVLTAGQWANCSAINLNVVVGAEHS